MITRTALLGIFCAQLVAFCALLPVRGAAAAELVIVIHAVDSPEGELQIELYGVQQRATFPYADRGVLAEARIRAQTLQPPGKEASVSFGDLAPGSYAVSVIHDANGNGDIDLNMLGIPIEGYGFSNGARGTIGPPSFDAAAVHVGPGEPTRIEITLNH
jgi:uncharacterized protein (DUF2141 family)